MSALTYNSDLHAYVGSRIAVDEDAMAEALASFVAETYADAMACGIAYDTDDANRAAWEECRSEDAWPLDAAGVTVLDGSDA